MARPRPELVELAAGRPVAAGLGDADLVHSALEHRMGGLLWSAVGRDEHSFPGKRNLARADVVTRARHQHLWCVLAEVRERLAAIDVEVATIKGIAVERRWYERVGERPCVDLDLLVAPEAVPGAEAVVRALQPDHPLLAEIGRLAGAGTVQSVDVTFGGVALDVHFDPLKLGVRTRRPGAFWAGCSPTELPDGTTVLAPDASTALVLALLHLNRDRFRSLLAYADVARLLAAGIDWAAVDDLVGPEGLALPLDRSLARVTDTLALPDPRGGSRGGVRAAAWEAVWPASSALLGDEGRLRFHKRQNLIPLLARGRARETVAWWWQDVFPPAEAVAVRYRDLPGPYLRRLAVGRAQARAARRRDLTVARVAAAPAPTPAAVATAAALRARATTGLELPVRGGSMGRTLRTGSRVRVVGQGRPRRGELWAFCTADGTVLVHRYRGQIADRHELRGDTRREPDPLVGDEQLIGRVVARVSPRPRRLGLRERLTAGSLRLARRMVGRP